MGVYVNMSNLLIMENIVKNYPGVSALKNVDFNLNKGEIHALMGQNGAGKSTLIKILTGAEFPDKGEIILEGKKIRPQSPMHAQQLGINTVYQEIFLCPNLSIAENICIGHKIKGAKKIKWTEINKIAKDILNQLGIDIDVTKTLDECSVAIKQITSIARALITESKILILDEPTSSLEKWERKILFEILKKLKKKNIGIIYITHFIDEVYEIADKITVLRNGEKVGEYKISELPKLALIEKMLGKEYKEFEFINKQDLIPNIKDIPVLEAVNIQKKNYIDIPYMKIKKGEVVGLAGLLGSGRTETAHVLFGLKSPETGIIKLDNKEVKIKNPKNAILLGLSLCPEDRKYEGIFDELSVRENIIIALQAKMGILKAIPKKVQEELAKKYIDLLEIKTSSTEELLKNLSGGTQQKVILARWLATEPKVLILDEPTKGIDIGTKVEIQKLIIDLAKKGISIIFISSELEEEIRCSIRLIIFKDKKIIGELEEENVKEDKVMQMIAGGN